MNDRYLTAFDMKNEGKNLREIGDALGVSKERARQMILRGERITANIAKGVVCEKIFDGMNLQTKHYLSKNDIKSYAALKEALDNGVLEKIEGIGEQRIEQIRKWLNDNTV